MDYNCNDFDEKINRFIFDKLNIDELEAFMEHMKKCDYCKNELEIYYLSHKIFDDSNLQKENAFNLKASLKTFIDEREERITIEYKHRFFVNMMFFIGNGISVCLAIYFVLERIIGV